MDDVRREWLDALLKIVDPVLNALESGKLKKTMPLFFHNERSAFAPLEAFGRSMLGLAPWLAADRENLGTEERILQEHYREKAVRCIAKATDPDSPDFMVFDKGGQPLVDTAFLAHAIVRAPDLLKGNPDVRKKLVEAFKSSRRIPAFNCNWIFFSAMVEAGLYVLGESYDIMRVLYALRTYQGWYKGDGIYGDGEMFHCDYYNSFVIQPMYVDLVKVFSEEHGEIKAMLPAVISRASRYAAILERLIAPDGSYPIVGRSICYRFGAFQMLSQAALQHHLAELSPAGVRCGLTAVIRKIMESPEMFDDNGWLLPGVYGYQPELAEEYINIGSLYLCSTVFLPLGLSPADAFWKDADEDWSGKKVWTGGHIPIDHAQD